MFLLDSRLWIITSNKNFLGQINLFNFKLMYSPTSPRFWMYYYLRRDSILYFHYFQNYFYQDFVLRILEDDYKKPISIESYFLCVVVTKDEGTHISYPAKKTLKKL